MLFALALSVTFIPHRELPSTFVNGRAFVMPRIAGSSNRMVLRLDSYGSGFIKKSAVLRLKLQTSGELAYLPPLDETAFPAPTANHGALPILDDADVAHDPVYAGIDGQLGWSWLAGRIWTIDYSGRHIYQDYSAPPLHASDLVPFRFDARGRYPQIDLAIDGTTYNAGIDTAAGVSLKDGVHATSFATHKLVDGWHAAHPDWLYVAHAGTENNIDLIQVPEVRAGSVTFHGVWFSTRPHDDVFGGDTVQIKLGPSAYQNCALTLDYVHADAGFECASSLSDDVLISAGHEGRPQSCPRFPKRHCNMGTPGEQFWNTIVADEATRKLRALGYRVAREPADFDGEYNVKAAIFIHFDGTAQPCTSGASIGYHTVFSQPAAQLWRSMYGKVFPFRFMPDNFTDNLSDYYGFRQVQAQDGALVLELGEMTCPPQRNWLGTRLPWEGDFIAEFIDRLLRPAARSESRE
jgi:hypothetical protein